MAVYRHEKERVCPEVHLKGDDESNGCRWPILHATQNDPQLPHVVPEIRLQYTARNFGTCQCRFTCSAALFSPPPPEGADNIVQARSESPL
jgi:hypothetical protein